VAVGRYQMVWRCELQLPATRCKSLGVLQLHLTGAPSSLTRAFHQRSVRTPSSPRLSMSLSHFLPFTYSPLPTKKVLDHPSHTSSPQIVPSLTHRDHDDLLGNKMPSLMFHSAGHMLFYVSSLVLITNMVGLAMASSFVASINPFSPANFIDTFTPGHYAIPMTDNKGNKHDMIISTVSLDTWFATKSSICPGTIYETSGCGWNPKALYNPTGASTSRTSCSIGVKYPTDKYTECYSIMPNISIMLGDNSAATPDLQLYADVGFLLNSTWDGSQQSGMLGLAAAVGAGYGSTDPSNPILLDISTRYSPQNAQFTLAFNRGPETGGWFTVGSVLPPHALPLTDPAVFQTPMEMATFNGRVNDLYVVTVSLTVLTAPSIQEQYSESFAPSLFIVITSQTYPFHQVLRGMCLAGRMEDNNLQSLQCM
jgi:hypothetical protein